MRKYTIIVQQKGDLKVIDMVLVNISGLKDRIKVKGNGSYTGSCKFDCESITTPL